jgi:hypothetical protein
MTQQEQSAPESDRSARVIARAIEIMKEGHYGWSWALAKARGEIRT